MKIKVKEAHCKCAITPFYENVALVLGKDPFNLMYECTKINVSKNVQDLIFEYYKAEGAQDYEICMRWCCFGPKVDETLEDFEVEIFDGFCIEEDI